MRQKLADVARHQAFKIVRMNRRDIKGAQYNPRTIDAVSRKKLVANLRKVGLLETLTVNSRTGNLVAGHQRLAALDVIEGTDNYLLDVAVTDLSEAEEKAQNVFMNNPSAQGYWDLEMLNRLLKDTEVDLVELGFADTDLRSLFPDDASLFGTTEKTPAGVERNAAASNRARVEASQDADKTPAADPGTAVRMPREPVAPIASPARPTSEQVPPSSEQSAATSEQMDPTSEQTPVPAGGTLIPTATPLSAVPTASTPPAPANNAEQRTPVSEQRPAAPALEGHYIVAVFPSAAERERILTALGLREGEEYVDGPMLHDLLRDARSGR